MQKPMLMLLWCSANQVAKKQVIQKKKMGLQLKQLTQLTKKEKKK